LFFNFYFFSPSQSLVTGGKSEIKLIAGFPPKAIANMDLTVEEADLMDS